MNDLISLHCSDTVLLMLFPGNLEDLETIVSAIFGSLSLVCVTEKKSFKHYLREVLVLQDKLVEELLKGMCVYTGPYICTLTK